MDASDLYADDHHWGDAVINVNAKDLPALKCRYLLAALPAVGRVLEIGCGGGRLLNTIAAHRPTLELHGCDLRPLHYEPDRFTFTAVARDGDELPYPPSSFDAVVLFDVLEHLHDPARMLHQAGALLRHNAPLISFTPLEGQPFSFYSVYRRLFGDDLYVRTKEHLQAFSEQELCELVEREYEIRDRSYAYHLVGHLMDATLFASLRIPAMRRRFWETNPYYTETHAEGASSSVLQYLLRAANALAYAESRILRNTSVGSAGMLFVATRRPRRRDH